MMVARPARRLPHEVESQHLVTGSDQSSILETHQHPRTYYTHTHTLIQTAATQQQGDSWQPEKAESGERNELHTVERELLRLAAVREVGGSDLGDVEQRQEGNENKLGQRE